MMRTATTLWSRAASGTLAAASLLALLGWVWRLAIVSDRHDTFWIELTIVATIGGVVALGWLR
ncbi:MAG TPA: hypothetical protein VED85_02745, partial [Burkholderiaceae bacterium]|nr:hypothetical protein [Burkholderiaceae bacterium]